MIGIFELILAAIFPFLKSYESLISMINTTILDTIGVLFVLYFTIRQYKHRFSDLGLSLKNFFRNVFYGITGYIATVPLLILAFSIIVWIANLFKYQPPPQPILEFFMEEKRASLLAYMSVFVAVLGPVAEEIFFRGFMYNAMKKATGLVLSIFLSAVFFALLHAQLVGFLPIMILGALLAYLYEKTGSLVPSITVHIIHNSVMVFFVFLMKGFAL